MMTKLPICFYFISTGLHSLNPIISVLISVSAYFCLEACWLVCWWMLHCVTGASPTHTQDPPLVLRLVSSLNTGIWFPLYSIDWLLGGLWLRLGMPCPFMTWTNHKSVPEVKTTHSLSYPPLIWRLSELKQQWLLINKDSEYLIQG